VLAGFASAGPFTSALPSGEGRFLGELHQVVGGQDSRELIAVWVRRVPLAQVGRGEEALRFALGPVPPDLSKPAEKFVRALARGDVGGRANPARDWAEGFTSQNDWGVAKTAGPSLSRIGSTPTYVRQKDGRKLYIVEPSTAVDARAGDGRYAELFPVSW
jgi:hypothetical protein